MLDNPLTLRAEYLEASTLKLSSYSRYTLLTSSTHPKSKRSNSVIRLHKPNIDNVISTFKQQKIQVQTLKNPNKQLFLSHTFIT